MFQNNSEFATTYILFKSQDNKNYTEDMDKCFFEILSVQSTPHLGTAAVCTTDVFVKSNSCHRSDGNALNGSSY